MASIVWLDLEGKRHKPRKEFSDIRSFRSYIKKNMANIKIVELLDCSGLNTLFDDSSNSELFRGCENLVEVKEVIGTSDVKNMSWMFNGCSKLEEVPLFDTSNVIDMGLMFNRCYSLKSVPLLDISNATLMDGMLYDCDDLESYALPCDEYNTRSSVLKSYGDYKKSEKMLEELNKLWQD